jgi:hypothetical protein
MGAGGAQLHTIEMRSSATATRAQTAAAFPCGGRCWWASRMVELVKVGPRLMVDQQVLFNGDGLYHRLPPSARQTLRMARHRRFRSVLRGEGYRGICIEQQGGLYLVGTTGARR